MKRLLILLISLMLLFTACGNDSASTGDLPAFSGKPYETVNNNKPQFDKDEITDKAFEKYGKLDKLGRCTECIACIGQELMPSGEREDISQIHPTGWQVSVYNFIQDNLLYNRCHLIGYQLAGENANERNLITGTRYLNIEGMLPFENMIAEYVKETDNHVMYRVTPVFEGKNLLASGVRMEAMSVEDKGAGVSFNIYAFNVEPGVVIDYSTGDNEADVRSSEGKQLAEDDTVNDYVLNVHTLKFHKPDCRSVGEMAEYNREEVSCTRQSLIDEGYSPCGGCCP